jgi:hypothetical protein
MERNSYPTVNSEKTVFMKRDGKYFIIHGLFVDDMVHTSNNTELKDEFTANFTQKSSKDFNITGLGEGLVKTF